MPNTVINNTSLHCQSYCSDVYPPSLRSSSCGKPAEGFFFLFSISSGVGGTHPCPETWHFSTAVEKQVQWRWTPSPPESLCGRCKGRDLGEIELKTVQNSICSYFCMLQVQLAPMQAANVSHLTDQTAVPKHTQQPHRWEVCVFVGADAAGGAVSGFIKTWKQELAWANTQLALCIVILQPLNCITMEKRLAYLQDWKILGNHELLGEFLLTF